MRLQAEFIQVGISTGIHHVGDFLELGGFVGLDQHGNIPVDVMNLLEPRQEFSVGNDFAVERDDPLLADGDFDFALELIFCPRR